MTTNYTISVISIDDELDAVVRDINAAQWDDANDISEYQVGALRSYLQRQDTVFIVCYNEARQLTGMASGRIEIKPYDATQWLYVDEVDVCVDHRRKGAGREIMQALTNYAVDRDCELVWLGTEPDNVAANALYKSLQPDETEPFVGYCYELD